MRCEGGDGKHQWRRIPAPRRFTLLYCYVTAALHVRVPAKVLSLSALSLSLSLPHGVVL
jgi:hypothetical protein